MKKITVIFFLSFLSGFIARGQDPELPSAFEMMAFSGKWNNIQTQMVCYICKLVHKEHFADLGISLYEPEQTLEFEVVDLGNDPFTPHSVRVKIEAGKFYRNFFKEGGTYSLVAERTQVELYLGKHYWEENECNGCRPSTCDVYKPLSIVASR